MSRSEVKVISKQGWIGVDNYTGATTDLIKKEIMDTTGLTSEDFIGGAHGYSIDPSYLRYSLKTSMQKMNL